jgi:hypothetical protein
MRRGRIGRLAKGRWRILAEAIAELGSARLAIVFLSFETAMRRAVPGVPGRPGGTDAEHVANVRWAIGAAARRVPWRALCLEQAVAAQRMLARRDVAATIHYGVARQKGELAAHAWVHAGPLAVVGTANAYEFVELARFPVADDVK